MKRILVALAVLLGTGTAHADPVIPSLHFLSTNSEFSGNGTPGNRLRLTSCGSSGQTWVWNGSAYACATVGGTYTAGTGLQLIGSVFSANLAGGTCSSGFVASALSSGGTLTCTAIGTQGGVTGTGTSGTSTRWNGTTSLANGSWLDTGSALSTTAPVTLGNQIIETGRITPTALTAASSTNNYNPTGLSGASSITQLCNGGSTACTITGLAAQATDTLITFRNDPTSTAAISFINQSASSSAGNKFTFPYSTGLVLNPGYSATFRYMGSDWQIRTAFVDRFFNLYVDATTTLSQLAYQPQTFSTTGTSNNVTLNSNASLFKYTGAGTATITGFAGAAINRVIVVYNSTSNDLTLANMNGGSLSQQQFQNMGADVILHGVGSSATYVYETTTGGPWRLVSLTTQTHPEAVTFTSSLNGGAITLSGGTGTATVTAGTHCTCTDSTANASVKCAVSSTTLTATGTGTDVISYLCF